jgi:hypothetical protein
MTTHRTLLTLCFALLSTQFGNAASVSGESGRADAAGTPDIFSSSSSSLPDAPDAAAIDEMRRSNQPMSFGRNTSLRLRTGPFSQFAMGTTLSIGGLGFQVATPLATKLNLRVGASMLNYSPTIMEEGFPIDGRVRMRSANVGVDVYPYRGSFHITPGITLYNGNRMTATTSIAPGGSFTINDNLYISDASDPVRGWFDVKLGPRIAPSLTMGWGNMLKRSKNWNLQTDFGIQYIGRPSFTLVMTGTVCEPNNPSNGCTSIQSDPDSLADLRQEQATVNQDIQVLRFYPILSTSLSYRFGHKTSMTYWR